MATNDNRYSGPEQIRDQRVAPWFSVDHVIILEWLPIIGPTGYALYSLYLSLAAQGQACPGIRRLAAHIGGSWQSVRFANRVLEWSGLIRITPGDRETANIYDILDPPAVSDELLSQMISAALADQILQQDYAAYFQRRLLVACQEWRPFWMRRAGDLLRAKGSEPEPADSPTLLRAKAEPEPEPATAVPPDPADLAGRLAAIGMAAGTAAQLIQAQEPAYLAGWLDWIEAKLADDPTYFRRSVAGYLLRVVGNGDVAPEPPAPPAEYYCSFCGKAVSEPGICPSCQERYGDVVRR